MVNIFLVLLFLTQAASVQGGEPPPVNGFYSTFYANGSVETEGQYVNGKKEGVFKNYFESGVMKGEWKYKEDVKDGPFKLYFPDGALMGEGVYSRGKPHGRFMRYDEKGRLRSTEIYEDGVLITRREEVPLAPSPAPLTAPPSPMIKKEEPGESPSPVPSEPPPQTEMYYYESDVFEGEGVFLSAPPAEIELNQGEGGRTSSEYTYEDGELIEIRSFIVGE